jgi:acyl carrier protein
MNEEKFLAKVAGLANVAPDEIADDTPITPAEWDSVDVLDLISIIDESFGITVPLDKVNATHTVGELRALVREAA